MALGSTAMAVDVNVNLDTTQDLSNSVLLYNSNDGTNDFGLFLLPDIAAGSYSQTVTISGDDYQKYQTYKYTLLSNYGTGGGVSVAMDNTAAGTAIGNSFETVFNADESTISTDLVNLRSDDALTQFLAGADLNNFFSTRLTQMPTVGPATLIDFSNGFNGGTMTVTVTPVPEPATLLGLGAGALVLVRRRKRSL